MTLQQWNTVIGVNLTGQFLCAREAVKEFKRRGVKPEVSVAAGKIICMSSVHDVIPWSGHVNYASSKGGVMMLMKSMAQELAPWRIRVFSVCPGAIKTPINTEAWETPEALHDLMSWSPTIASASPRISATSRCCWRPTWPITSRHQRVRGWRHDALSGVRSRRLISVEVVAKDVLWLLLGFFIIGRSI